MNRSEAQQQLEALAHALREEHILDPRDYPVLDVPTHAGVPLWRINVQHLLDVAWSDERAIAWLEHEAIKSLVLDG